VTILLPLQGLSKIGSKGGVFHSPEIDQVLFDTIRTNVRDSIKIVEVEASINDLPFAKKAVEELMKII